MDSHDSASSPKPSDDSAFDESPVSPTPEPGPAAPSATAPVQKAPETNNPSEASTGVNAPATSAPAEPPKPVPWALYGRLGGFAFMLALAIVGMRLIRIEWQYVWIYWLGVFVIYMGVSMFRGYHYGKLKGGSLKDAMGKHFMHWGGLIIVLGVMMLLITYTEIPTKDGAIVLTLLLAITCYLAGVHFDRLFIVLGVFLGVITLLATLQNQWIIWLMAILVGAIAVGIAYLHFRHEAKASAKHES